MGFVWIQGRSHIREYGPAPGSICVQMIQFWRRLSGPMTHHQVGWITVDRSFVREPGYLGLNSDNATGPPDMGTHRAYAQSQPDGPPPWLLARLAPMLKRTATCVLRSPPRIMPACRYMLSNNG